MGGAVRGGFREIRTLKITWHDGRKGIEHAWLRRSGKVAGSVLAQGLSFSDDTQRVCLK